MALEKIKIIESPLSDKDKDYSFLIEQITTEASKKTGLPKVESIFLKAVNTNEKMVGGLSAYTFYGCLVIDVIWIDPFFRRKGIGKALIQNAEILAKKKGLSMISVSTMEWWEATQFYKKCGFCIEFIRKGFRGGFKQYHLIKYFLKQNENKN